MRSLVWCRFSGIDPYCNLAKEETLFDTLLGSFDEEATLLVLYTNRSSLIVGKHQNPWCEVDLGEARRMHVPVLRRISGGGTVYHDEGNLVFSFMSRRECLDREQNLLVIRRALASLGMQSDLQGTFDLYAAGKKISGNSFCFRRDRGMHHGTLLVDADRTLMRRLLKPAEPAITTHAVASRPAHTVNLREIEASFDPSPLVETIVQSAADVMGISETSYLDEASIDSARVAELEERNHRWEWNFGRTPLFSVSFSGGGESSLRLRIKSGVVDAVEENTTGEAATHLVGCRFEKRELLSREGEASGLLGELIRGSELL